MFCNNPSDNITEIRYFGTVRLLRPKQNKFLYVNMEYMDLLSPPPQLPPASFTRARLARPINEVYHEVNQNKLFTLIRHERLELKAA